MARTVTQSAQYRVLREKILRRIRCDDSAVAADKHTHTLTPQVNTNRYAASVSDSREKIQIVLHVLFAEIESNGDFC